MMIKLVPVFLLAAVLMGCTSINITNLTPTTLPRDASGQYLVEMAIDHRQHSLREETVSPYVVIGFDSYKMVRTPKVPFRWETYIPVPADKKSVNYYFKVLYQYNAWRSPREGTRLSHEYKLTITD